MQTTLKRPNICPRRLSPVKHKVTVCTGGACTRRGGGLAMQEIKEMLQIRESPVSADGRVRLDTIPCSGNCEMAPLVIANNMLVKAPDLSSIPAMLGYKTPAAQKTKTVRPKKLPESLPAAV